jgi:hypothetical protein
MVVNAAGDTVARLTGPQSAGINRVTWNFAIGGADFAGRGGGGRGIAGPGSPTRPSESQAVPDSSGSPTAPRDAGAGRGGRGGGGGGGFGGRGNAEVETGAYRVVLDVGGVKMVQVLRVVRVEPGQVSIR